MNYFIILDIIATIFVILYSFYILCKSNDTPKKGEVYCPGTYAIIILIYSIFGLVLLFIERSYIIFFIKLSILVIDIIFFLNITNYRILYDEQGFIHINFIKSKTSYSYEQIDAIRVNRYDVYLYINNMPFIVSKSSIGANEFLEYVKERYRLLHDGEEIPNKTYKYDIFNGHLKSVPEAYLGFCVMILTSVVFFIFSIYFLLPHSTDNTLKNDVIFESCYLVGPHLEMITVDQEIYKLMFIDEDINIDRLAKLCNSHTKVSIYCEKIDSRRVDESDFYSIKAITLNDFYLLPFEETYRLHLQEYWGIIPISMFVIVFCIGYTIMFIKVARNPQNYNKRIVEFFFRYDEIIYDHK